MWPKTVVYFKGAETLLNSNSILRREDELVESCTHLGVHLDNRLDRKCNTEAVCRKAQSRRYFLCVLQDAEYLVPFFLAAICRSSSIRASDTEQADKEDGETAQHYGQLFTSPA